MMKKLKNFEVDVVTKKNLAKETEKYPGPRVFSLMKSSDDRGVFVLKKSPVSLKVDEDTEEQTIDLDKDVIKNDPFERSARFISAVSGDVFGIQSDFMKSHYLNIGDEFKDRPDFDSNLWVASAGKFEETIFLSNFGGNNSHLKIETLDLKVDGYQTFKIMHHASNGYLSVDEDGMVRTARKGAEGSVSFVDSSSTIRESEIFILIPHREFHENLVAARDATGNKERIGFYKKAMELIENKWDLMFFIDDLIRLVALKKKSKDIWASFINAGAYINDLVNIIQDLQKSFGPESEDTYVKITKKQLQDLKLLQDFLDGSNMPEFPDDKIISFYDEFNKIKLDFKSANASNIDSFVKRLKILLIKRAELDHKNSSDPKNNMDFSL